jgi:hypothetical protein
VAYSIKDDTLASRTARLSKDGGLPIRRKPYFCKIDRGTGRLLSPGYFPVEMRVTPSITIWDPAATNVTNAVRSAGNTQIPLTTPTPNGASTKTPWRVLTVAGTPPFTVGQDYWFHLTADARL